MQRKNLLGIMKKAFEYRIELAEDGERWAQRKVVECYKEGILVEKDEKKAEKFKIKWDL